MPFARLLILSGIFMLSFVVLPACAETPEEGQRRVPAEYEGQAAIWMQWPGPYEKKMRHAFVEIIKLVSQYQPVHVIASNETLKAQAEASLKKADIASEKITFHVIPTNNAWLRDNGPVYVEVNQKLRVLDFGFDAWGGNFGKEVEYQQDNRIPKVLAKQLKLPYEDHNDYILERGNLEVDGQGIGVFNWDCQKDRNPDLSKAEQEQILKESLGLKQIIWAYGHHPDDFTTGHIDGIARFIAPGTLVVSSYNEDKIEARLVKDAKAAGLKVLRYPGDINWLVGNGFVLANHDGDIERSKQLRKLLSEFFPNRKVHLLDGQVIGSLGGGIHCVTNDQPQFNLKINN